MDDYKDYRSNRINEIKRRLKLNKPAVLDALKKLKVTSISVSYTGSGDSGQVDSVDAFSKDEKEVSLEGTKVTIVNLSSKFNQKTKKFEEKEAKQETSLGDALREIVYDILEMEYPGWEINDGSSGNLRINVKDKKFKLEHTTYYTESKYEEKEV